MAPENENHNEPNDGRNQTDSPSLLQLVESLGLSDLQTRILFGLVIGGVALALIVWGPLPFAILTFVVAAAMSWEWSMIVRGVGNDMAAIVHILSVLAIAILTGLGMAGLAVAAAVTGAFIVLALVIGSSHAPLSGFGVLYTGLPVVALGWLRSDGSLGLSAALFIILVVIITDVAAYGTGRMFGGARLWPAVSPNKTWSGLIGGVCAATLFGAAFPFVTGTGNWSWLAGLSAILALIAQGGDLAESALKRHFGRKDASTLLPGHGGFMDRLDGLVTASLFAIFLAFMIDAYAPARAFLYGS